jgi:hypothetical protein
MRFWLPALVAIAVVSAGAHHPFTPYYDLSKPASISGSVVELRSRNPHIVLVVDGTAPDGRTGLWAFEGQPPGALLRNHADYQERLKPGVTITISGWPAKDPQARAFSAGTVTFADGSTLVIGSTNPTSSDVWRCSENGRAATCGYTYPIP